MNAYELAKYIEDDIQIQEGIADMLRQQANQIAELEKILEQEGIGIGSDLLNGGIAIVKKIQTKPLSDEEIENIAGHCCHGATAWHSPELDIYEFARAIEERHGIK